MVRDLPEASRELDSSRGWFCLKQSSLHGGFGNLERASERACGCLDVLGTTLPNCVLWVEEARALWSMK